MPTLEEDVADDDGRRGRRGVAAAAATTIVTAVGTAAAGGWIHRCGVAGAPGYHGQDEAGQQLPDHQFPLGMTARFAEPVSKGEY